MRFIVYRNGEQRLGSSALRIDKSHPFACGDRTVEFVIIQPEIQQSERRVIGQPRSVARVVASEKRLVFPDKLFIGNNFSQCGKIVVLDGAHKLRYRCKYRVIIPVADRIFVVILKNQPAAVDRIHGRIAHLSGIRSRLNDTVLLYLL